MTAAQVQCRAPGCDAHKLPSTHSPYCPGCRRALSRHGHPCQAPLTFHEMAPVLSAVKASRKRNPGSAAWAILEDHWGRLADHARDILAQRDGGTAGNRREWQAAEMLRTVVDGAAAERVVDVVLALYLLRDQQPGRFRDDKAFRFTLVRRVRHCAPLAVGSYWNPRLQLVKKVFRDAPPPAIEVLADWLLRTFGAAGLHFAHLEKQRGQQKAAEGRRLAEAMEALA